MIRLEEAAGLGGDAVAEARENTCLACGASGMEAFYQVAGVPAQTCVLLDSESEAADYPTGDILLAFCGSCGFIQNVRFDPNIVDYSKPTEESQAFSPRFTEFASDLADDLVERHHLVGRAVLEVGCGKGDFLQLLLDRGIGSGLGVDPGYLPNRDLEEDPRVHYRREWYDAESTHLTGDLILTRHLMEHVPNVSEFFGWLVSSAEHTDSAVLFTEVPDTARVLKEGAFWDVYHEHCSYFTIGSLARALRNVGLSVERLQYGYDNQYLLATATFSAGTDVFEIEESPEELADLAGQFAATASSAIVSWRKTIEEVMDSGRSVAVWGGGSKAAAFLTAMGRDDLTVVDINPHKQGKWLPGSGVMVEDPGVLQASDPDLVIPMNPIYVEEIREDLTELGLTPRIRPL